MRLEETDVTAAARYEIVPDPVLASPQAMAGAASRDGKLHGAAIYRMLTGCDPADADVHDDTDFDQHVLASILAVAATEGEAVGQQAGLETDTLAILIAQWFPAAPLSVCTQWCGQSGYADDDEIAMVRDLLLAHRSTEGNAGAWLAAMIARRSMEPNHLWEDLGLRERSELTRLLMRHFFPIASRNTRNMRWKRFFYRSLCEDDGLVMCTAPVCTQCSDFTMCFGEENGESRLAYRRRALALQAMPPYEPGIVQAAPA